MARKANEPITHTQTCKQKLLDIFNHISVLLMREELKLKLNQEIKASVTDGEVSGSAKDEIDEQRVERGVEAKHWRDSH